MIVILKRLKQQLNNISSHVLIIACSIAIQIAKMQKLVTENYTSQFASVTAK